MKDVVHGMTMESPNPYRNVREEPIKFHEGWLEHKNNENKWVRYWCVLKNNVLFFFSSERTASLTHVGTLSINNKSKVESKSGDSKNGYKFDLHTPKRISNCKVHKSCERELWKAYIEGIATGSISDTIDLLPGQIREIHDRLAQYLYPKPSEPVSPISQRISSGSVGSYPDVSRRSSSDSNPSVQSVNSFDSPLSSDSGSFVPIPTQDYYLTPVGSCPDQLHQLSFESQGPIFYIGEPEREAPSWFFIDCDRQFAEQILCDCHEFGNTLMRSKPNNDLDIVISKRSVTESGVEIAHFKVTSQPNGYKIEVDNPHEPMGSLVDVMNFFMETSGRVSTRLMRCNDKRLLGLDMCHKNPYNTSIIQDLRHPHTTKETSTPRNHRQLSATSFIPPDVTDLPPPPPPHIMNSELQQIPPMAPPSPPCNRTSIFPPPPPPHTRLHCLPQQPELQQTMPSLPKPHTTQTIQRSQVLKDVHQPGAGARVVHHMTKKDRSVSEPTISKEILDQVQEIRRNQLKQLEQNKQVAKRMPGKSLSFDENPPPLPPNHPTAGKTQHQVTNPLHSSALDIPDLPKANDDQKTLKPILGEGTKKRFSVPSLSGADNFLDELARVRAKVTKQPLAVKKAPEVAPKPSSLGARPVSSVLGTGTTDTENQMNPVLPKVPSVATESFKKKLGNVIVGTTKQTTNLSHGCKKQEDTQLETPDTYENLDRYQNTKEILALSRSK